MKNLCETKPHLLNALQQVEKAAKDVHDAHNDKLYSELESASECVATLLYTLNNCTDATHLKVCFGNKRIINLRYLFEDLHKHFGIELTYEHTKHPDFVKWFNGISQDALGITYRKTVTELFGDYVMYWEDETLKEYMYYNYWYNIDFKDVPIYIGIFLFILFSPITVPLAILTVVFGILDNRKYIDWESKRKEVRKVYGC